MISFSVLDSVLTAVLGVGGGAVAISFVRRTMSRNGLDAQQFDSLKKTLDLLHKELERERAERMAERREWREHEGTLKKEILGLRIELTEAREKMSMLQRMIENLSNGAAGIP